MNLLDPIVDETRAAVLEADEQSARRVGDLLAEAGGESRYFFGTIPMKRRCAN